MELPFANQRKDAENKTISQCSKLCWEPIGSPKKYGIFYILKHFLFYSILLGQLFNFIGDCSNRGKAKAFIEINT